MIHQCALGKNWCASSRIACYRKYTKILLISCTHKYVCVLTCISAVTVTSELAIALCMLLLLGAGTFTLAYMYTQREYMRNTLRNIILFYSQQVGLIPQDVMALLPAQLPRMPNQDHDAACTIYFQTDSTCSLATLNNQWGIPPTT